MILFHHLIGGPFSEIWPNMYITMQYHTVQAIIYQWLLSGIHPRNRMQEPYFLKWSLLALHMGQHPNLLRLQRRRLSQFIGNQFMGNPINPHLLEKKRKFLLKTTVQLPQDYTRRFGTPTWSPLYRQGDQYGGREDEEMRGPGYSAVSVCPDTSFHPAPIINPRNVMYLHWNILLSLAVELLCVHIWCSNVFHLCE